MSSVLSADVMPFSWSTTGSFSPASGVGFSGVAAGAPVYTDAAGNLTINLGTINFANPSSGFSGTFSLTINFGRPYGSQDPVFTEPFNVVSNFSGNQDRLTIDFPASSPLTFNGTDGQGTFTFGISDFTFERSGTPVRYLALTGTISDAAFTQTSTLPSASTPEPMSVLLLGSLVGAVAFARKGGLIAR